VTEPDAVSTPLKQVDEDGNPVQVLDRMEPGMIEHLPPGKDVQFGTPPSDSDYEKIVLNNLMAAGAGMHIPYQLFTGDVSKANFSSTRAGRLSLAKSINKWRWNMVIPHFCDGVFGWFLQAAEQTMGSVGRASVAWTPPRAEMVDPTKETAANKERVRCGFVSWPEVAREQGYDPDELLEEIAEHNARLDELGITLDTDPRNQSSAGQSQTNQGNANDESTDGNTGNAGTANADAAEAAE
jgi:capsid protein